MKNTPTKKIKTSGESSGKRRAAQGVEGGREGSSVFCLNRGGVQLTGGSLFYFHRNLVTATGREKIFLCGQK